MYQPLKTNFLCQTRANFLYNSSVLMFSFEVRALISYGVICYPTPPPIKSLLATSLHGMISKKSAIYIIIFDTKRTSQPNCTIPTTFDNIIVNGNHPLFLHEVLKNLLWREPHIFLIFLQIILPWLNNHFIKTLRPYNIFPSTASFCYNPPKRYLTSTQVTRKRESNNSNNGKKQQRSHDLWLLCTL